MALKDLRIGYVPYSPTLEKPGDRRRFVHYARRRNIAFELADQAERYDVVVLSECADISVWSRYTKGSLVYDLIDSYLAIPRKDMKGRLRGLAKFVSGQSKYLQLNHWKAIEEMCYRADAVICTTEEQRRDILPFCDNVHIILDAHSMVTRSSKKEYVAGSPFRIVWEGVPQTLESLKILGPVLERLNQKYPLELHLVTDLNYFRHLGRYGSKETIKVARDVFSNVILHPWDERYCADAICSCDLGVIPLMLDDPFIAGKPENKLLLMWRLGMPTVVSASPAYARAMDAAGLEMACTSLAEWQNTLEHYIVNEEARRYAGEAARRYVEENLSDERLLAAWDSVMESLA